MRSTWVTRVTAVLALSCAPAAFGDEVLYSFESGSDGWGAFGPLTTDSGVDPDGAIGQGRYHVADFGLAGWGIVAVSPSVDLSAFSGLRVTARLREVPGFTPFAGTPVLRMGVGIGEAEWLSDFVLTETFAAYSANFADLTPDGVFATAPITPAELADPNLQIKFVIPKDANTGVGEFNYDQVTGLGGGGRAQILPGTVIYDFDTILNSCYPDDWTFFGHPQTDFGLNADVEDGSGAFQAADWTACDLFGYPQCEWVGSAIGVGVFNHPQCEIGGVDDAGLDLSLGTGITIRVKNNLEVGFGGTAGARVQLQLVDSDGTTAVTPRAILQNPAVNRMPRLPDEWTTLRFFFDGLDWAWDNDSSVAGSVPGLDLANIESVLLLWRRESGDGVNVFEFDEITLIDDLPQPWADSDSDQDVDLADVQAFQLAFGAAPTGDTAALDANDDEIIDALDSQVLFDVVLGPDTTTGFFAWAY